jgi:cadmium resistance protein CadD (predicted permease)
MRGGMVEPHFEDQAVDDFLHIAGLAAVIYAAANVDDILVLAGFYADPRVRVRFVTAGQFIGIAILFGICAGVALLAVAVSARYIGLAGLAPIALGVFKLWELWRRKGADNAAAASLAERHSHALGKILTVTAATMGNSSDALGVWAPVMAVHSHRDIPFFGAMFALMTGLWCFAAFWMAHHPTLGAPIRRSAHLVVPFVLIGLGFFVLDHAGSLQLIGSWLKRYAAGSA